MALVAGTRLGPYEILSPLGAGGMGEVYVARDTRLGREVAVKILPEKLASDPEALDRFEREARALAALSHPNILVLHDFGKHDGTVYAVMELLKGETLRACISRSALPWTRVCEVGIVIAEGLAAAHSGGVIHRDLKPENIFLTSTGGVKILDFGLARIEKGSKAAESWMQTSPGGTAPGVAMGTVGYMSPEQIRGQELDARTDIFSFGCVLYEMATGKAPFARGTAADTISAILKEDPPELVKSGIQIPQEVDRIILHCLEKNPDNRFHSARDIAFDLKEVSSGIRTSGKTVAGPAKKRGLLAVLVMLLVVAGALTLWSLKRPPKDEGKPIPIAVADFANETGEKELNGLSGMFITSLEQSRKLSVLTRSRMFDILKQMGKDNVDTIDESLGREICRKSGVNALVTASVRKFGSMYTIDLKVLDPSGESYLFTAKEEAKSQEGVPEMLDRLSEKTRIGLKENVSQTQVKSFSVSQSTTANLEAYQHYFQGEQDIDNLHFDQAVEEMKRATELDPNFAMAYFRLAYAQAWNRPDLAVATMRKAMQNISKVPPKEQGLFRGFSALLEGDKPQALAIYKKVAESYPDEKEVLWMIGDLSFHMADYNSAMENFEKLVQMDPQFERGWQHLRWTYLSMQRPDRALDAARRYFASIKSPDAYSTLGETLVLAKKYDEAKQFYTQMVQLFPKDSTGLNGLGRICFVERQLDEAGKIFLEMASSPDPSFAREGNGDLIDLYLFQGQFKKAIEAKDRLLRLSKDNPRVLYLLHAMIAIFHFDVLQDRQGGLKSLAEAQPYEADAGGQELELMYLAYLWARDLESARKVADKLQANNPFLLVIIEALESSGRKDYTPAIAGLQKAEKTGNADLCNFVRKELARNLTEAGRYDEALRYYALVEETNLTNVDYPLTILASARVYKLKGDRKNEEQALRKFLDCWKNADPDLPQFREAKSRLAELSRSS